MVSYFIANNSTSKIKAMCGSIGPPGCGLAPYANSEGIYSFHFEPTGISCKASTQPCITPFTGNEAGWLRCTELSNTVPSINVPW